MAIATLIPFFWKCHRHFAKVLSFYNDLVSLVVPEVPTTHCISKIGLISCLFSGITADYRLLDNPDNASSDMSRQDQTSSDTGTSRSRPTSLDTPPPLPERPPPKMKKSILKSSKSYDVSRSVSSELDDPQILLKNTKANEMFAYRKSLQQAAAPVSVWKIIC